MLRGDNSERYGWVIGGGTPALAAAVYMIRDGKMKGENIYIFEKIEQIMGEDDLEKNDPIFDNKLADFEAYDRFMDVVSEIPSTATPDISVKEELIRFNEQPNRSPLNQYNSMLLSIRKWLKKQGVVFNTEATVQKLNWEKYADTDQRVIHSIIYKWENKTHEKNIGFEDPVIVTNKYKPVMGETENFHNLAFTVPFNNRDDMPALEAAVRSADKIVSGFLGLD